MLTSPGLADTAPAAAAPTAWRTTATDEVLTALCAVPWLSRVPHDQLLPLSRRAQWRNAAKGARLATQGQAADCLLLLVQGRAHAERQGPGGRSVLLQLLQPGDLIGDLAVLDGEPQGATVRAVWPSRLLQVSAPDLTDCLARSPALCAAMAAQMVERLRDSNLRIQRLALAPVVERVYAQLHDWSDGTAEGERVVHERLSRAELAKLVGASREMVSRALRTLLTSGRLTRRGRRQLVLPAQPATPG